MRHIPVAFVVAALVACGSEAGPVSGDWAGKWQGYALSPQSGAVQVSMTIVQTPEPPGLDTISGTFAIGTLSGSVSGFAGQDKALLTLEAAAPCRGTLAGSLSIGGAAGADFSAGGETSCGNESAGGPLTRQ